MVDGITIPWQVEHIPDSDSVYMRVHQSLLDEKGEPIPGAFRLHPSDAGMSVDWDKYSTAEQARQRARQPHKNAVISMQAGQIRVIPGQEVFHRPILNNRAHSEVLGEKTTEARVRFGRIFKMVIAVGASSGTQ